MAVRRIDKVIAAAMALAHLAMIGYIVYSIFFFNEPDWPMYWTLAFLIDVPLAILWLVAFVLSLLLQPAPHFRPNRQEPLSVGAILSRLPLYFWLALAPSVFAACLQLATLLGAKLGKATDSANFLGPLSIFGTFGTLVWSDLAARITRVFLRRGRKLPPLPPVA